VVVFTVTAETNPVTLNHVRQRTSCDCVVATAATIANLDYAYAADRSPVPPGQRPMQPSEISELLQRTTGILWRGPCSAWWHRIEKFVDSPNMCVLSIRKRWSWPWKSYHCITVGHGKIYDPEFLSPLKLDEYQRRNWTIVKYFRPRDFSKLRAVQEHNEVNYRSTRLWNAALEK
jgi:hypothetical protein